MFHVSTSKDIRTSPSGVEKTQILLNFSTFLVFQMKYFFLIPKVHEIIVADPGTLSSELQGKLGLEASKNSIFQKLTSKIGPNSNFAILHESQKFQIATKIGW